MLGKNGREPIHVSLTKYLLCLTHRRMNKVANIWRQYFQICVDIAHYKWSHLQLYIIEISRGSTLLYGSKLTKFAEEISGYTEDTDIADPICTWTSNVRLWAAKLALKSTPSDML